MSVVKKFNRDFGDFKITLQDWEILNQGVTALWGPSGAGKSSLIRGLLGLDSEVDLEWDFNGEDLGQKSPGERQLGVVFQELGLFPHLTARQNILFPVDRKKHSHWEKDFEMLTRRFQIDSLLSAPVLRLSGGEKQRVALARSLIYRPRMLLLDEPFSSLDEELRKEARQLVLELCSEFKCPLLLVTHDREDVEQMAQKVTSLYKGKIIDEKPVSAFSDLKTR